MAKKSKAFELYLIRHGQTEWSEAGRHTGLSEIPLTAEGRRQARRLRPKLKAVHFALVLTSPLSRARDTAALAGLGRAARPCDDLHEWDYGRYEGLTIEQIRRSVPEWTVWTRPCPGGETAAQVRARADAVLKRAGRARGPVALFAHGHILRVIAARWLGLPPAGGRFFELGPASISRLGYEHETRVLQTWNES